MPVPVNILLTPLSALYGAVTSARLKLYSSGALAAQEIDAPVISVGNITTGGTGKTPLVAWLARRLSTAGERVCILTRGYGRAGSASRQVVVSDGVRLLADAREAGDEPRLLAEMLQGVAAVICHADRATAARWALKNLNSSVFILDDGFQHLALKRDLNLLTIDATNPWGGGKLLPRGRLREPLRGIKRADAVIITRANQTHDIEKIRAEAERLSGGRPALLSEVITVGLRPLFDGEKVSESNAESASLPQPVAAFCALGNPQAFFEHARDGGLSLAYTKSFTDHHVYTQDEIDAIVREAKAHGARSLLTTAKDAVKLRGLSFELPCYVLEIDVSFDDEGVLLELMNKAMTKASLK
ncbi:MAG: tetraacyldisaccharide 4'-kinase [Pyrinomonadaceae bacterium]|nr:tetraacyldisaccharide 4'-kinase [Pyrinomonadaceae bacterium]